MLSNTWKVLIVPVTTRYGSTGVMSGTMTCVNTLPREAPSMIATSHIPRGMRARAAESSAMLEPPRPDRYRREDYLAIELAPEAIGNRPYALHQRFLTRSLRDMIGEDHFIHGYAPPNRRRSWNATNFTGAGKGYAEADLATRRDIERLHLDHALDILFFLQHDEAVPADVRESARCWGQVSDEFADNGHVPYHFYVREARRIVGRGMFTEHDALLAPGSERTPCHADSIAITDFPLDSLACASERRPWPPATVSSSCRSRPARRRCRTASCCRANSTTCWCRSACPPRMSPGARCARRRC